MGKSKQHRNNDVIDGEAKILDVEGEEKEMNNEQNQEQENKATDVTVEEKNPIKRTWNKIPKKVKTVGGFVLGAAALLGLGFLGFKVLGGNSDDSDGFDQDPVSLPFNDDADDTIDFADFQTETTAETENVEE